MPITSYDDKTFPVCSLIYQKTYYLQCKRISGQEIFYLFQNYSKKYEV